MTAHPPMMALLRVATTGSDALLPDDSVASSSIKRPEVNMLNSACETNMPNLSTLGNKSPDESISMGKPLKASHDKNGDNKLTCRKNLNEMAESTGTEKSLKLSLGKDGDDSLTCRNNLEEMHRLYYFKVGRVDAKLCFGIFKQMIDGMDNTSRMAVIQQLQQLYRLAETRARKRRAANFAALEAMVRRHSKIAKPTQPCPMSTRGVEGDVKETLLKQSNSNTAAALAKPKLRYVLPNKPYVFPERQNNDFGPNHGSAFSCAPLSHMATKMMRQKCAQMNARAAAMVSMTPVLKLTPGLPGAMGPVYPPQSHGVLIRPKKPAAAQQTLAPKTRQSAPDSYSQSSPTCPKCKKAITNARRLPYTHERNNGDSFYYNYRCCYGEYSNLRYLSGQKNRIFSRLLPPPQTLVRWIHNGRKWRLSCRGRQWTRCEYCRALYMFGRGTKGYHTKAKCPLWQQQQQQRERAQQEEAEDQK